MKRYDGYTILLILSVFLFFSFNLSATVAPIEQGQSLWWIVKRIGLAVDTIESKVDLIDTSTTGAACGVVELDSMSVSGGSLSISTAGSYCLKEDITADVTIGISCVQLDMNGRCITGTITVGAGGSEKYIVIKDGFVTPPTPLASGTNGIEVQTTVSQLFIENVVVECLAAIGSADGCDAIDIAGDEVQISNCTFFGGVGASGGAGLRGGHGIVISSGAGVVSVHDCTISSGDASTASSGNNGGNGGNGIDIRSASSIEIKNCLVFSTGSGGTGGNIGGNGGNGGHGVFIDSACVQVSVHNCVIRDTGAAGSGGSGGGVTGVGGKAVDDDVVAGASASKVYANFAQDIANAIKFDLQASGVEKGFALSNPPTSTAVSVYANVFI